MKKLPPRRAKLFATSLGYFTVLVVVANHIVITNGISFPFNLERLYPIILIAFVTLIVFSPAGTFGNERLPLPTGSRLLKLIGIGFFIFIAGFALLLML